MASITKRGNRWLVQIRRKGSPSLSGTFASNAEAKAWATVEEARIQRGELPSPRRQLAAVTLAHIIDRYIAEVTPTKKSCASERLRLGKIKRDPLAANSLLDLTPTRIADYRDRRLLVVEPATVHRELAVIRHALEVAQREWGHGLPSNPAKLVKPPRVENARDRRLGTGEFQQLMVAVNASGNTELPTIVELAIETGLRRSELLDLSWKHVNLDRRVAHIPLTKTGKPRTIPLTLRAVELLSGRSPASTGLVFRSSANAVRLAWTRAITKSGLENLRFNELRQEAVSWFFELGLSVPEVASISGHRDPRMLFRYAHMSADTLARKLSERCWSA